MHKLDGILQVKKVWAQLTNPCDQLSHQFGAFRDKMRIRNLVKIVKYGRKCEIWSKLWNPVKFVRFGWNCEILLKLWNLATRWHHLHYLRFWPPGGATSIFYKFGHLHYLKMFPPGGATSNNCVIWSKLYPLPCWPPCQPPYRPPCPPPYWSSPCFVRAHQGQGRY